MTNLEKLRSMSGEKIAEILTAIDIDDKIHFCQNKTECDDMLNCGEVIPCEMCQQCALERLKREAQ